MSRVGKQPVNIPAGVKASVVEGIVKVEGPRGSLAYKLARGVSAVIEGDTITFAVRGGDKQSVADYGTARSHVDNMVKGVTEGWKRSLEVNGVGYTASMAGTKLLLKVGFAHDVDIEIPEGVSCQVQRNIIDLMSHDKQLVGNVAAKIRKVRPPEPYLGKGIKYVEEVIKRKAGKTAK
ncbi:MAG: 50S ribosomal protein L6 [Deltaproteobacteria bacterium]|nr:50S ribosomal protein L6 [Deltaproteobacteria bacterium]